MEQHKIHTIDASGRILGRLATEISVLLQGKHKPDYLPYKDVGDIVIIKNVDKLRVTGRKADQKKYFRHSRYMGGVTETPYKKLFKERPNEVLKIAVSGMLPKNKLRIKMLKRLKFE